MLLGLLLPVLAGFVIAKTGFGSRSTSQAMEDVSHSLHLPKISAGSRKADAAGEDTNHTDVPKVADPSSAQREDKLPLADKKFMGIF